MQATGRGVGAVLVLLAAIVLAGCGGGGGSSSGARLSKAQYEQKLKTEGAHLQASTSKFSLNLKDLKSLAQKLGTLQGQIEAAAKDFDSFRPPANAVADNKKVAEVLHKLADLFGKMKADASHNDVQKIQQDVVQLRVLGTEGSAATGDLKSKGYKVGKFG